MSQITLKPLDDGPKAVEIPLGKTTIGRGPFLGCSDKKVSRNHALLEVNSKGEVFLTPTHVNPCFYQPTADSPGQILKKDVAHKLENGDSFSLLPRAYRYQLVVKDEDKVDQNEKSNECSKPNGSATEEPEAVKDTIFEEHAETDASEKPFSKDITEDVLPPEKEELDEKEESCFPEAKSSPDREKENEDSKDEDSIETKKVEESVESVLEKVNNEENESTVHLDPFPKSQEASEEEEEEEEEVSRNSKADLKETEKKVTENCKESREKEDPFELPSDKEEDVKLSHVTTKRPRKKGPASPRKPRAEKQITKRKKAASTDSPSKPRGRKKAAKTEFSDETVKPGRTSGRTNRQTRQGLSLEDFVVSDDEEWQSDRSEPKRRRKRHGSDSGSDWETEHKKPRKSKLGSGSESGSDWGSHKKKGGPKGRRRKTKQASEEEEEVAEPSAPKSEKKQRIPCTYGKNCYRRNQNHTDQFSHPGDSDYASDVDANQNNEAVSDSEEPSETPKKECPYGENCFRKNPQHKKDFKHTKKVRPQREAAKKGDKKAKGSRNSDEIDSYDLNDSFLADDSADEYKPPHDSGSDYESGKKKKKVVIKGKRGRAKV